MKDDVKLKLLRDLYASLEDIQSLQDRHLDKLERLEQEADMTVISIRELEKELEGREDI